ncbi:uncharacterized protein DS421_16g566580 [Arachis hypogaea]|nr:uncharacterized protein DS421_16g566580 [Arachis hypogaea]
MMDEEVKVRKEANTANLGCPLFLGITRYIVHSLTLLQNHDHIHGTLCSW